jgi:hypothetical protein
MQPGKLFRDQTTGALLGCVSKLFTNSSTCGNWQNPSVWGVGSSYLSESSFPKFVDNRHFRIELMERLGPEHIFCNQQVASRQVMQADLGSTSPKAYVYTPRLIRVWPPGLKRFLDRRPPFSDRLALDSRSSGEGFSATMAHSVIKVSRRAHPLRSPARVQVITVSGLYPRLKVFTDSGLLCFFETIETLRMCAPRRWRAVRRRGWSV